MVKWEEVEERLNEFSIETLEKLDEAALEEMKNHICLALDSLPDDSPLKQSKSLQISNYAFVNQFGNPELLITAGEDGKSLVNEDKGTIMVRYNNGNISTNVWQPNEKIEPIPEPQKIIKKEMDKDISAKEESTVSKNENEVNDIDDNLEKVYEDIRDDLKKKGIRDWNLVEGKQGVTAKEYYDNLKAEYENTVSEIDDLYKKLEKENKIARTNGMTQENADRISEIADDIKNKTYEAAQLKANLEGHFPDMLKETVKEGGAKAAEQIKSLGSKIKEGFNQQIENGKESITEITGKVKEANQKAIAAVGSKKQEIFTDLSTKVEEKYRSFLKKDFELSNMIKKTYEKALNVVEKVNDFGEKVTQAGRNTKNMVLGKIDQVKDVSDVNYGKDDYISKFLKKQIEKIDDRMNDTENKFNRSKQISIEKMEKSDARASQTRGKTSFEEKIAKAKKEAVDKPSTKKERGQKKEDR